MGHHSIFEARVLDLVGRGGEAEMPLTFEDPAHRRCMSEDDGEGSEAKEEAGSLIYEHRRGIRGMGLLGCCESKGIDGPNQSLRRRKCVMIAMIAMTAACMSLAEIQLRLQFVAPISLDSIGIPHFPRVRMDAVLHTKQLRHCVEGATKIPQFSSCLSVYLSVLPSSILSRALSSEALGVKSEARHLEGEAGMTMDELRRDIFLGAGAEAIAASGLEACLSNGVGEDSMAECLTSSLSKVPGEVLSVAIKQAKAHPAFDWSAERKDKAVKLSSLLYACIRQARRVGQGDQCLGEYLAALPQSLTRRSMRVVEELPKPRGRPLYPL